MNSILRRRNPPIQRTWYIEISRIFANLDLIHGLILLFSSPLTGFKSMFTISPTLIFKIVAI